MTQTYTEEERDLIVLAQREAKHGKRDQPPVDHLAIGRAINRIAGFDPSGMAEPDAEKVKNIARLCKMSTTWVRTHLCVLRLSPEAQRLVEKKTLEGVHLPCAKLTEIADIGDPARQLGLVEGLSRTSSRGTRNKCF